MITLIVISWLLSGAAGSWLVIHFVGTCHPWLNLRLLSAESILTALFGPFNMFAGFVFAAVFWRDYRTALEEKKG